jgi:hypothetical protein
MPSTSYFFHFDCEARAVHAKDCTGSYRIIYGHKSLYMGNIATWFRSRPGSHTVTVLLTTASSFLQTYTLLVNFFILTARHERLRTVA